MKLTTILILIDHIHQYVIEKAKNILLGARKSVSEVTYEFGFEYPSILAKYLKRKYN